MYVCACLREYVYVQMCMCEPELMCMSERKRETGVHGCVRARKKERRVFVCV